MKRNYYIFACAFFFSLGGNILGLSLIFRLTDQLLFSPGQIGTFMALGLLFYFVGCNLYHRTGSRFHPLKVFSVSSALVLLASLPLGHLQSAAVIYVSYAIVQLATGLFWPPVMAYLTEGLKDAKTLGTQMGLFNRSWMAANMAGPLIAGNLYQVSSTLNFAVINASYFGACFLLFLLRRHLLKDAFVLLPHKAAPAMPAEPEAASGLTGAAGKKLDLFRYRGWLSGFSSTVFVGVLVHIVPLHIRDGLGHSEATAGTLLFLRCVAGFAGFALLAKFTFWHFNRRWFIVLQSGLVVCTVILLAAGASLPVFFVGVLLYGFLNAACYNNSMFYSGATGNHPKKNLAMHEIFLCLGNASGTAGGGIVYQHFGFTGTCLALIFVLAIGLVAYIKLDQKAPAPN